MASTFQTPQHATRGIDATRLQAPSAPQIASRLPSVSSPHSSFQQLRQPSQHSQQHQPQHQQQQAQSPHTARRQTVLSFGKVTKTSAPSSRRLSRVPTDDDPILSWTDRDSAAPLRAGERRRTVVSIGQSTSFGFSTDQPAVVTAAAAATAASRESETTESVGNATNGVTSRSPSAASSMVTRSRRTTNEFLNFSDVDELHVAMTQIEARARKPAPRADGSFFPNSVDGAVWNKEWNQLAAVRRLSDRRRVSSGSTVEEESLPELPKLPSHADSVRLRTLMAVRGVGARSENVSDESAEQQTQSWTWNGQILEDKIAENIEKVIRTTSSDFPNVQLASTARLNSTMKRTSAVPGTPTMSGLLGLNSATQNIVTNDHHNELPHTPKPLRRLELGRCPFFSDPDLSGEEPERVYAGCENLFQFPTEKECRERSNLHALHTRTISRHRDLCKVMKWAELSPHPTNARNPTPPNTAEQESLPYVEPNGTTFRRAQKPPASAGSIGSRRLIDDVSVRSALRCLPLAPAFKPTLCNRMAKRFAGSGSPPMATSATAATAVAALTAPAALDAESVRLLHKRTLAALAETHARLGATRGLSRLARERVVLDSVLSAWLVTSDGGCDSACRCDVGAASNDGDHETEEGREQSKHGHRADECRAEPVDLLYPSSRFLRASGMGTIVQRYAAECFGFAVGRDSVPWGARPPKPLMVRVVGRPKPAVLVKTERKRVASPVEPEGARPERSAPLEDSTAVDPQASAAPIPETELPITEAKNVIAMDTTRWDEGEALRVVFTPYAGDKPVDWELGDASVVSSWDNEGSDRLAHVKTPFEVRTVAEGLPEDEALVVQSDATA